MAARSFYDDETTEAASRGKARRDHYAEVAAERLHGASDCQFCLLPYQELARAAAIWYEAASEAMMRANYGPLDEMIRDQVRVAAEQGFELDDILQLLRILRETAVKEEGWSPDQLAEMDDVIDEAFQALRGQVAWNIPDGLKYLTGESREQRERAVVRKEPSERRKTTRNHLRLPIRVKTYLPVGAVDEITRTENVARGGLYFLSKNAYYKDVRLHIMYPYWDAPGAINTEYPAEVVRIDDEGSDIRGIAVRFLVDLGRKKGPA
jgi:hypothetical protein